MARRAFGDVPLMRYFLSIFSFLHKIQKELLILTCFDPNCRVYIIEVEGS